MTKTFARRGALVLTLATGFVIAGCGGGDDSNGGVDSGAAPEDVVEAFYNATVDGDVDTVCALITEETAKQAAEQEDAESCEESADGALTDEKTKSIAESVEVGEATVDGDSATVAVSSQEAGGEGEINLVQEDGEWKIDFAS